MPPPRRSGMEARLAASAGVSVEEARPALAGGVALALTLAAHFIAVPLRDECGAAIGQAALPALFLISLPFAAAASPLVGGWLAAEGASGRGGHAVRHLLRWLALAEGGAFVALASTSGAHRTTWAARAPRVFYFSWRSASNAAALSAVWSRVLAAVGSGGGGKAGETASRLVGPLGAAATGGQLAGSAAVAVGAWALRWALAAGWAVHPVLLTLPGLAAAVLLWTAGNAAAAAELDVAAVDDGEEGGGGRAGARPRPPRPPPGWHAAKAALTAAASDPLARAIAVLMALASSCSAWAYLVKQAVVAAAAAAPGSGAPAPAPSPGAPSIPASAARMAYFATISATSAAAVASLQLCATGAALSVLPPGAALAAGPAVAAAGFAAVALAPNPATVAIFEAGRKTADYVLSRPARDAAFAALEPTVLFAAKLALDALAPRAGDAAAAAAVGGLRLVGALTNGPAPAAAAAVPVAAAGVWAAGRAGRAQVRALLDRTRGGGL